MTMTHYDKSASFYMNDTSELKFVIKNMINFF
jgi:hypothetical protein